MSSVEDTGPRDTVKPSIGEYRRHLLICTGPRCTREGESQTLFDNLGAKFKAAGLDQGALRVKRSRVNCFAACKGGPVLCVQPDGVWYSGVTPRNMDRIIDEHLVGGRVVEELVFHRGPGDACAAASSASVRFSGVEREAFHRLAAGRRDMRHFRAGATVEPEVLDRLLHAAHLAPSVGLMQPWRFVRVTDRALRERIAAHVEQERQATAQAMDGRATEFLRLKVEGIRECAELVVAALAPDDGTMFGRRTMPRDMAVCSLACAVQNLWLAARADNLGLGWVSMFDPNVIGGLLGMPEGAQPLAILCIGPVDEFYEAPLLQLNGWRTARGLEDFVFENRWNC